MSSVGQPFHGFPDLWARLYDELLDNEAEVLERWLEWERELSWSSLKRQMHDDVVAGRPPQSTEIRVDNGPDRPRRLYVALRGMDEAFRFVNPSTKGTASTPHALVRLEDYVAEHRRLDSPGRQDGALIPRLIRRNDMSAGVDHVRDLFINVQRVPKASWDKGDIVVIDPPGGLATHDVRGGFHIACVPVIADPAEMRIEPSAAATRRRYRIGPRDDPATSARIGEIVAGLDADGVQLAIAPEATLTPSLLDCWQRALRAQRAARLRYVLAGTGNLHVHGRRVSNTAVLLDGRTGEVVGRQEKLFPFNMTPEILRKWKLTPYLGDEPIAEDLAVADRRLTIFELGTIRLAVLICEDLKRPLHIGRLIADFGVSHLLVPVFSRPLKQFRWEHNASLDYARETGTAVIVSNSLVMADILCDANANTALIAAGDGEIILGQADAPTDLVRFRLQLDGSAEPL